MQKIFVVVVFCISAIVAAPYNLEEDVDPDEYYLVPVHRIKR